MPCSAISFLVAKPSGVFRFLTLVALLVKNDIFLKVRLESHFPLFIFDFKAGNPKIFTMPSQRSQRASTSSQRKRRAPTTEEAPEDPEDLEEMTSNFVRYVIIKGGSGLPIKKSDLQEYTAKNSQTFNMVLERARVALGEIYGYELRELDGKVKCFTVANVLPHVDVDSEPEDSDEEDVEDADKVLVLLILTHVFMSNGCAGESKFQFFKKSKIALFTFCLESELVKNKHKISKKKDF